LKSKIKKGVFIKLFLFFFFYSKIFKDIQRYSKIFKDIQSYSKMESIIFSYNSFGDTSNTTSPNSTLPSFVSYLCLLSTSIFFGTNYVPVKKFDTGDGMFFQLMICIGIWLIGCITNVARNFPPFHPLTMLGRYYFIKKK
jgi:hypothetical protein